VNSISIGWSVLILSVTLSAEDAAFMTAMMYSIVYIALASSWTSMYGSWSSVRVSSTSSISPSPEA